MKKYNIPTAEYEVFNNPAGAFEYLETAKFPIVVKADGLALGKGVIIAETKKKRLMQYIRLWKIRFSAQAAQIS